VLGKTGGKIRAKSGTDGTGTVLFSRCECGMVRLSRFRTKLLIPTGVPWLPSRCAVPNVVLQSRRMINDIRSPSFTCKQCHRELSMPRRYWLIVRLSTVPVAFLLCFALGLRGIMLFVVCAAALPLVGGLVVIPLSYRLFPPTLERYLPEGSLGLGSK